MPEDESVSSQNSNGMAKEKKNRRRFRDWLRSLTWKRALRLAAGVLCLILAVVGGFIPIFQGWVFFVIGMVLLGFDLNRAFAWGEKYVPGYTEKTTARLKQNKWIKKLLKSKEERKEKRKTKRQARGNRKKK